MIINKHIEKKILTDYFFVEGKVSLDADYLIKSINKSIKSEINENYKTHIKGQMTPWDYFAEDKVFNELLQKFIKVIDENFNLPRYQLADAWGYCLKQNETTNYHNHKPFIWSGAVYLNKHSQRLNFPQINQSVKPEKGTFVLFSSFLQHGCEINKSSKMKYGISFNMNELTLAQVEQINKKGQHSLPV